MILSNKTTTNVEYAMFLNIWIKMRDVLKGEEHMKNKSLEQNEGYLDGTASLSPIKTFDQYLRPTDLMRRLGGLGLQRFCDYIYRAKFYPFPLEIKSQSLGLIENQPASFELPVMMEGVIKNATANNESIAKVLSIVNDQQLEVSRIGLLLTPSNEEKSPFNIAFYKAEAIVDWIEVIVNDSETAVTWVKLKTDEVDENKKPVYLILILDENRNYAQYKTTTESTQQGDSVETDTGYIQDSYLEPMASENKLNEIPFVIVNMTRLGGAIERPYLESVADGSISLFRASAHHEDALYWGGESTLFTRGFGLGEDEKIYVGNGATNKSSAEFAEANFVTMGINGIKPREENVTKQFEYCVSLGVDLINKGAESGTALNIRSNVKTASLKTLALTGALGVQTLLKIGAVWLKLNSDEVKVTANTTFADAVYTAEDFVKFSSLVAVGAMRSVDLYMLQLKNDITTAETFEDWKKDLESYKNLNPKPKGDENSP